MEFSAAAVAGGLERDVIQIEEWCESLVRRSPLLQSRGEQVWPDGTVAGCYQFVHALYQETIYRRIATNQRIKWPQQIGVRLEVSYGSHTQEIAAELAMHFVRGRDVQRAIHYLQYVGEQALQRNAHQEAIAHLTYGLEYSSRYRTIRSVRNKRSSYECFQDQL